MVSDWSLDNGIITAIKIHVHEGVEKICLGLTCLEGGRDCREPFRREAAL